MACHLFGTKPSIEHDDLWLIGQTSVKLISCILNHFWKCYLQIDGHFVSVSICPQKHFVITKAALAQMSTIITLP